MTGIDYPTVSVGRHENLIVRVSFAAKVLMRRRGIDPNKVGLLIKADRLRKEDGTIIEDPTGCPDWVANTITVFSCMVAENFVDTAKPGRVDLDVAPSSDYWAILIEDFGAIERAVWTALGKALEEQRTKLAAVPPREAAAS